MLTFALVLAVSGCSKKRRDPSPRPASSHTAQTGASPIVLHGSDPLPEPQRQELLWRLAAEGDPMNLASLGERLGAARLAELVESGGRLGSIALDAFAYAPDAYQERASLCRLLPRLVPPDRRRGLSTLERVRRPKTSGEQIDAEATYVCRLALRSVARAALSPEERDLVEVSLDRTKEGAAE